MASTSAPVSGTYANHTTLPGLQVSPQGAMLNSLKVYNFGITDVREITGSSTAGSYTVSGLTTNDVVVSLSPSTGLNVPSTAFRARVGVAAVSAANTLDVSWVQNGTSTSSQPGLAAPGAAWTLMTFSYYAQSSSTTT